MFEMYYNGKIKWLPCAILLCCQYNCKQILTILHDDVLVKCNLQSSFSFAFLIGKLFYVKLGSQRIPISQDYTSAVSGCPWRFTCMWGNHDFTDSSFRLLNTFHSSTVVISYYCDITCQGPPGAARTQLYPVSKNSN